MANIKSSPTTISVKPVPTGQPRWPLKLSSRRLVDQDNIPFLINGDTPWSLISGLTREDAQFYLNTRKTQGFNALIINIIEHEFNGPNNRYGANPFLSPGDFSKPNEAYWTHADFVIEQATQAGFLLVLTPSYLGYGGGSQGWYAEVTSAGPTVMGGYARFLENRYKNYQNIIWLMGGDVGPMDALDEIRAMASEIQKISPWRIFSAHNQRYESAVTKYQPQDITNWLKLNNTYSSVDRTAQDSINDFLRTPTLPFYFMEGSYEYEGADDKGVRSQAYWSVLAGSVGHFLGVGPFGSDSSGGIWGFGGTWKSRMNSPGAVSLLHFKKLFLSRDWASLTPDTNSTYLKSGNPGWSTSDAVVAAVTASKQTLIAYTPAQRALTIDTGALVGTQFKVWWVLAKTGQAQAGANIGRGTQVLTPPASGDWVLVIDDLALSLPAPG